MPEEKVKGTFMNTVLFFVSIICTLAVFLLSYRNAVLSARTRIKRILPLVISCGLIALTLASSMKVFDPGQYESLWSFTALVSALSCFISLLSAERFKKEQLFLLKAIAVIALLEITLFNIPSYRTWTGNYPQKEVKCTDFQLRENGVLENDSVFIEKESEFSGIAADLDIPVCTVFVDASFHQDRIQRIELAMDIKDETHSTEFRPDIVKNTIVNFRPGSHYFQCDLSGKVGQARFRLRVPEGERVSFSRVVFNKPVPFEIVYFRFVLLTVLSVFIYSVTCGGVLSEKFSDHRRMCSIAALFITAGFFAVSFMIVDYRMTESTWKERFRLESGNQVTEELVEAFKKGHVYLDRDVEDFLSEIDNPYDEEQRSGHSYAWDHVLYKGRYYSYYGIAPVILLFLPYNLITGYYCPDELAMLVFAFIAFTGITKLYMAMIRKWFLHISSGVVIACLFILQLSSGIWYSIGRADFYEVSLSAGLAFISWAIYFLFESDVLTGQKISCAKTFLSSLFFSLAVLSRPTLAVYCVCAAVLMFFAVPDTRKSEKKKLLSASSVRYLLCAFVPMVVLGSVQMAYNYARFGSVLDFGIQYSLTINDFTRSEFHTKFSLVALYNYLFNPPVFETEYPFVRTEFQHLHNSGYFYVDVLNTLNTSGLFMLVPLTWFYVLSRRAMRVFSTRREKIINLMKIIIPCLVSPVIIIASVWESGYAVRYMGDFSVQIILGAYILMFLILSATKNETIKKLVTYFVCFSVVWTLYVEGVQILNQAFRYQQYNYTFPEIAYDLENLISFWH